MKFICVMMKNEEQDNRTPKYDELIKIFNAILSHIRSLHKSLLLLIY